jgi:hypothetical protein
VDNQTTPIVLMGYYNPIHRFGVETFVAEAKAAGVDGLIIVDLPPEHDAELATPAQAAGIDFIRLTTPTTDDARLPRAGAQLRVRLLRVGGRCDRCRLGDHRARDRGHCPPAPAYRPADQRWFRHSYAGAGCEHRPPGGCGGGSALVDKIAQAKVPTRQ